MPLQVDSYDELYDGVDKETEYGVYLLKRQRTGAGHYLFRLTECPACGETFRPIDHRHSHIAEHSPDEFGL
jgi:Ribonuclease G/E